MNSRVALITFLDGGLHPDQGLPGGGQGGYPDNTLPGYGGPVDPGYGQGQPMPPHPWRPGHGRPPRPDQGLPGSGAYPNSWPCASSHRSRQHTAGHCAAAPDQSAHRVARPLS